jgi:hypothetical protein
MILSKTPLFILITHYIFSLSLICNASHLQILNKQSHFSEESSISKLLAKEAIKTQIRSLAQNRENVSAYETEEVIFEISVQKNGDICIMSSFIIDAQLAVDALKIQIIKRNPTVNPYNAVSILAQLRVLLFEMIEHNNPHAEEKAVDEQTTVRYLVNNDQELLIYCVTYLSKMQYQECVQEISGESHSIQNHITKEAIARE